MTHFRATSYSRTETNRHHTRKPSARAHYNREGKQHHEDRLDALQLVLVAHKAGCRTHHIVDKQHEPYFMPTVQLHSLPPLSPPCQASGTEDPCWRLENSS